MGLRIGTKEFGVADVGDYTPQFDDASSKFQTVPVSDYTPQFETAAPAEPSKTTGFLDQAWKGAMGTILRDNPEAVAGSLDVMRILATPDPAAAAGARMGALVAGGEDAPIPASDHTQILKDMSDWIRANAEAGPDKYQRSVPTLTDIGMSTDPGTMISRLSDYLGGALGSGVGSSAPSVGTGLAVGALTENPIAGFLAGAMAPSYIQNLDDMFKQLSQDKGIQAQMAQGKITQKQLAGLSAMVAVPLAALDAYGLEKTLGLDGQQFRGMLLTRAIKRAMVGGATEFTTEGTQQLIQETTSALAGSDQSLAQHAVNVLDAAIQGGAAGFAMAGSSPGHNAAKRTEHSGANPATTPGLEEPSNQNQGQPTPGGLGGVSPPPVGASAPAAGTIPSAAPSAGVVSLPEGAVEPTISAAVAETPVKTPAPPGGVTGTPPATAAIDTTDTTDEFDPDTMPEEDIAPEALAQTQSAIADLLRQVKAVAAPVEAPNQDLAAALAATTQPDTPVQTPQVPTPVQAPSPAPVQQMPEPRGTPEAAARRVMPQPVEAPPVSPQVPASPAVAPAVAPEPIAAFQATPPTFQTVEATPPADIAQLAKPAPASVPALAPTSTQQQASPLARQFADALRVEFANDPLQEHPQFEDTISRVAQAAMGARPRGVAPTEAFNAVTPRAVQMVMDTLAAADTQQAAQAAASEQQAAQRAQEVAHERRVAGAPQERERAGKTKTKSAEGVANESDFSTMRAVKREMEKPEAERDPDLMAYREAREARKKIPKRGDANKLERNRLTAQMQAAQKRRVERLAAAERITAPTPSPQPAGERGAAPEEVKPGLTTQAPAPVTETQKKADQYRKAKERNARVAEPLRAAHNSVPRPNFGRMTSMKQLHTEGVEFMKETVKSAQAALKAIGDKLGDKISRNNSLEENLAIFARELLGGTKHPGMGAAEFESARIFAEAGAIEDFYNLVTNEQMAGTSGELEKYVASHDSEQSYDEGSSQFLASVPAGWDVAETSTGPAPRSIPPDSDVVLPVDDGTITVRADKVTTAKEALKEHAVEGNRKGIYGMLRRAHIRRLRQLVPNLRVIWVSHDEMEKVPGIKNAAGLYYNLSPEQRARGEQPYVLMNTRLMFMSPEFLEDVLVHELTHGATSFAIDTNVRGSEQIFKQIMNELVQHIATEYSVLPQHLPPALRYGFKNLHELVTEAFSNRQFMEFLARIEASPRIQKLMGVVRDNQPRTWWRVILDAVSNALGLKFGNKSISYLDAVMHATVRAEMSEVEQQDLADVLAGVSPFVDGPGRPRHAFDVEALTFDARTVLDAVKGKAGNRPWSPVSRAIATKLSTTGEMKRQSRELFGGFDNPFERWVNLFLSKRALKEKYAEPGDSLTQSLAEYDREDLGAASAMANTLFESTQAQVDPSQPLTSPANKHISKAGLLDTHRRVAHARLSAEFAKLPAKAQKLYQQINAHYQAMEDMRVRKVVRNIIQQAVSKFDVKLPAGKTIQDGVDWVMSGDVDRLDAERTPDDLAWHAALGKTAETLAGSRALRQVKGTYVPLLRYGKYFFTARHEVKVPPGAILDPGAKDKNVLIFHDKKDVKNYLESTDEHIGSVVSRWVDPATGKRTQKVGTYTDPKTNQIVIPQQVVLVTVQNKTMEMADSQREAEARRTTYPTGAYTTSAVDQIDSVLKGNNEILPAQINRLIGNMRQSSSGALQEANIAALTAAYIRQMSGSRAAHRRLKRQNTHGFSRDLVRTTMTANRIMAGHLANLDVLPGMAEAEEATQKIIDDGRNASTTPNIPAATLWRRAYVKELKNRIEAMNTRHEEFYGSRGANILMNVSFMRHLFTPSFLAMNLVQPWQVTYPVLAGKYGDGATIRAMIQAYRDLGAGSTIWRGFKETGHEARKIFGPAHRVYDFHAEARRRGSVFSDGALFQRFMDRVDELGVGAQSGIEAADIHEIGRGRVENAVARGTRVARATSEAAEAVNRYTTGLAALRLAKRAGLSDAEAIDYAVSTVEQTQGGYAAENNPAFMSHWILRVPLQFKKYALMYGQLYYGNLSRALNFRGDRATRVEATKTLIRLSATTMALAGTFGLPFWEIGRMLLLLAAATPLNDDDWESWENGFQGWFGDALKVATGSETFSRKAAEVFFRGSSRMLGFDTSSRLGNDSLVLFGDPKSYDEADVKTWLFDMALGAPGGVASDLVKFTKTWDPKYLPWPKVLGDAIKAQSLFTQGVKTRTGAVKAPPLNGLEAIWQVLGFRPASQAEAWETGGSGAVAKEQKKFSGSRTLLMGDWTSATPGERATIFRGPIADWNRAHPGKAERIEMGDLRRSLARRKQLGAVQ